MQMFMLTIHKWQNNGYQRLLIFIFSFTLSLPLSLILFVTLSLTLSLSLSLSSFPLSHLLHSHSLSLALSLTISLSHATFFYIWKFGKQFFNFLYKVIDIVKRTFCETNLKARLSFISKIKRFWCCLKEFITRPSINTTIAHL